MLKRKKGCNCFRACLQSVSITFPLKSSCQCSTGQTKFGFLGHSPNKILNKQNPLLLSLIDFIVEVWLTK